MQSGRGRRKRLVAWVAAAFALAATGASLGARPSGGDLTSLTRQLDELAREKARVQQQLRGVKQRQRQVVQQLNDLDSKLALAQARLDRVSADVDTTRGELADATARSREAEQRLQTQEVYVSERLVAIYQSAETKPLEVLLQSASFSDFANRLYLIDQVVTRDAEVLEEFDQAQQEAEALRAEVEARHEQLRVLQSRIAQERERTSSQRRDTEQQKQRILRDRLSWERALASLEQDSREIEQMLRRLQRARRGDGAPDAPWTGSFRMPVSGRITSGFGYRTHPILRTRRMHTGIDIAAPSGTPIRAAGDGTVVFAGTWGGYGNTVIVDHGGGFATLYAHCSRLAVTTDQRITQGQVIAYVGSTGLSTGPHLHFEVRRDGRPVDPSPHM